jgi:hypothetical protein
MEQRQLLWVWSDMKGRCLNPNHRQYKDYGGRGITVCDRWMTMANFLEDMSPRPQGMMLDRIDNNGPYSPDNCRWATRTEQNSNRRNCIYVNDAGERVTLKEYCRRHGLKYRPIVKRIQDRNWPVDLALSVPVGAPTHFLKSLQRTAA